MPRRALEAGFYKFAVTIAVTFPGRRIPQNAAKCRCTERTFRSVPLVESKNHKLLLPVTGYCKYTLFACNSFSLVYNGYSQSSFDKNLHFILLARITSEPFWNSNNPSVKCSCKFVIVLSLKSLETLMVSTSASSMHNMAYCQRPQSIASLR